MEMQVIDKDGEWFVNTAAFRLPDPTTGHLFEPGVKYKIKKTEWMESQPTIKPTTVDEDVDVLQPHKTGDAVLSMGAEEASQEEQKPDPKTAKK